MIVRNPFEDGVAPAFQHRRIVGRKAEQLADHEHGQPPGEYRDHVDLVARLCGAEERVDDTGYRGFELGKALGAEYVLDDVAQVVVARRVGCQEGGAGDREQLVDCHPAAAREGLPVAERGLNVAEAREREELPLLVVKDGRALEQGCIRGVRVVLSRARERVVQQLGRRFWAAVA